MWDSWLHSDNIKLMRLLKTWCVGEQLMTSYPNFLGVNYSSLTGFFFFFLSPLQRLSAEKVCHKKHDATNNQNVIFNSDELAFVWGCDQNRL